LSLEKSINRLGYLSTEFNDSNFPKNNVPVLFDVATVLELKDKGIFEQCRPLIALVSHATPSEIQHAMDLGAHAVITRPIHQLGLLSALQVSQILFKKLEEKDSKYEILKRKHLSRSSVIKAVVSFMDEFDVNEQKAYEMLRSISMSKNIEVEKLCEYFTQKTHCNHFYDKEA